MFFNFGHWALDGSAELAEAFGLVLPPPTPRNNTPVFRHVNLQSRQSVLDFHRYPHHTPRMGNRRRIWLIIFVIAVLGGTTWLILCSANHRLIEGKTEADWIKSINYSGDSAETDRWRALGPEGIRMLIKALNAGNGFFESRYPRFWGSLPPFLRKHLPTPVNGYPTRMCAACMLERLGPDAKSAVPALIQALKREKTGGVQENILNCFSYEKNILEGMDEDRADLLPELLRAMQSSEWGVRNDAALALACYTGQAETVSPVLLNALHDPDVHVRMAAAEALHQIAPRLAAKPEVVRVLTEIMKNPDDQVAYRAPELLGEMGKDASSAVPALIEYAHGTNALVADVAARALRRIDPAAAAQAGIK